MKCKLCGSGNVKRIYTGIIRDGGLGQYTKDTVDVFQCKDCDVIWHENKIDDVKNTMRLKNTEKNWKVVRKKKSFMNFMIRKLLIN